MNKKASFIVLCGGEGSGKSTVVEMIKRKYMPDIIVAREPGGSDYAESIRRNMFENPLAKGADAMTMFLQAWAARRDSMKYTVLPALRQGTPVVLDRGDCCTWAYQIYAQQDMSLKKIFWEIRSAVLDERVPDLYIFLDVMPEVGLKRVEGRPGKKNHFDEQAMAFHQRVREGYLSFLEEIEVRGGKTVAINANRSQEEVLKDVLHVVDELIKR